MEHMGLETGGHPNCQLGRRDSILTKEGKLEGERMGAILDVLSLRAE